MEALKGEHTEIRQTAGTLLKQLTQLKNESDLWSEVALQPLLRRLTKQVRLHIQHEEKVVYVLVRTPLSPEQQKTIAQNMLAK